MRSLSKVAVDAFRTKARQSQRMNAADLTQALAPDIQEAILSCPASNAAATPSTSANFSRSPWCPTGESSGGCGKTCSRGD
jgi:hypothetical protein